MTADKRDRKTFQGYHVEWNEKANKWKCYVTDPLHLFLGFYDSEAIAVKCAKKYVSDWQ